MSCPDSPSSLQTIHPIAYLTFPHRSLTHTLIAPKLIPVVSLKPGLSPSFLVVVAKDLLKCKSGFIVDNPISLSLHTVFVSITANPTKTKMLPLLGYHCVPSAWQSVSIQYILLNEIIVPDCFYFGNIFDKFIKANGVLEYIW